MRVVRGLGYVVYLVALLGALGCSHRATVGGLCPERCTLAECAEGRCAPITRPDTGPEVCTGADCPIDAGRDTCAADGCSDAGRDACAAGGCSDAGSVCARRLDLIFVIDDSASLGFWMDALYLGFRQFLEQPESNGIGVGLQRFAEVCEAPTYAQLVVPIAPLPGNLAAMEQALPVAASGSTSTLPAFDGALQHARTWKASHPDSQVAVVLLTDATPGGCDALTGDFNVEGPRLAREAFEGAPSIKTYVVGVGVFPTLAVIATAGGTEVAMINVLPEDGEVRTALEKIREDADPCASSQAKKQ